MNTVGHRRGICALLELAAVRLKQGSYSDHLIPPDNTDPKIWNIDPFTGQPFPYRPHGFEAHVSATGHGDGVERGQPILWADVEPRVMNNGDGTPTTQLTWTWTGEQVIVNYPMPAVYPLPEYAGRTADGEGNHSIVPD